jgi:hypothetical protein
MAGWKELLIDIPKLTDEVKRLNREANRPYWTKVQL